MQFVPKGHLEMTKEAYLHIVALLGAESFIVLQHPRAIQSDRLVAEELSDTVDVHVNGNASSGFTR